MIFNFLASTRDASFLPLHADDLVQRVDDFYQVALGSHDRFNRLVSRRRFVDDVGVLAAFHALGHALVVFHGEAALRLRAGHGTARAVAAAHEAFRVALAADDV